MLDFCQVGLRVPPSSISCILLYYVRPLTKSPALDSVPAEEGDHGLPVRAAVRVEVALRVRRQHARAHVLREEHLQCEKEKEEQEETKKGFIFQSQREVGAEVLNLFSDRGKTSPPPQEHLTLSY